MKVIGYIRESTKDQAENGYNLAEQERKIRIYFNYLSDGKDDAELEIISDGGYSAKTLKRPGIRKMMHMVKSGDVDTVIIHNLDRLTRSIVDLANIIDLFKEKNVNLISLTEKIETDSASGKFFLNMLGIIIAQWERETISERTKRGIDEAFRQKRFARAKRTVWVGYKVNEDGKVVVDEKYRELVIQSFNYAASGDYNLKELARIICGLAFLEELKTIMLRDLLKTKYTWANLKAPIIKGKDM